MLSNTPHVLIIDDDEGFCRLVRKHLERSDFVVSAVHSGEAGLAAIAAQRFNAVILDHILPEFDGTTLLSQLRVNTDAPPVVYLTGNQDSKIAVAALKAGATDYVVKDLDGEFLIILENAVTNAIFSTAIRRAKDHAEAEVRKARDEFKALADERALMLKEVNHRVSNSLQLIASLLHFQGDLSINSDVKAALNEANGRVLAVARVHRSLYTSNDVKWVDLTDYIGTLINDLKGVSRSKDDPLITLDIDPIQAGPDIAVSIGIITTELVLNAFKHAYDEGDGPVSISLKKSSSTVKLVVEDEGTGIPNSPIPKKKGIGRRIIAGMVDKLNGKIEYIEKSPGMRALVTFPVSEDIRTPVEQEFMQ